MTMTKREKGKERRERGRRGEGKRTVVMRAIIIRPALMWLYRRVLTLPVNR